MFHSPSNDFNPRLPTSSSVGDADWDPGIDEAWTNEAFASSYNWEKFSNPASVDAFYQDCYWSFPSTSSADQHSQPQPFGIVDYPGNAHPLISDKLMPSFLQPMLSAKVLDPPMIAQYDMGQQASSNLDMLDFVPDVSQGSETCVTGELKSDGKDYRQPMQELSAFEMNPCSWVRANKHTF